MLRCAEKVGTSSGRDTGCCLCCVREPKQEGESVRLNDSTTPGRIRPDVPPGDADLPDSEDDGQDNAVNGGTEGVLWDDPDFPTPSSIWTPNETFTGVEWIRPPVSIQPISESITDEHRIQACVYCSCIRYYDTTDESNVDENA